MSGRGPRPEPPAASPAPDLTLAIIVHESADLLEDLLGSVPAAAGDLALEILVVDVASSDDPLARCRGGPVAVMGIRLDRNRGYAQAVNRALERARGTWFALANADLVLEPGCLAGLVGALAADPGLGLVAPRIRTGDGSLEEPVRGRPSLLNEGLELSGIHRLWRGNPVRRRAWPASGGFPGADHVLVGPLLVGPTRTLRGVGGLDENYMLYFEEIDLCDRLLATGVRLAAVPGAVVRHRVGGSRVCPRFRERCYQRSMARYFAGRLGRHAGWVALVLQLGGGLARVTAGALAGAFRIRDRSRMRAWCHRERMRAAVALECLTTRS